MNNPKITVVIRVYNRIEDLLANLQVIRNLWKIGKECFIIVSFNRKKNGYKLSEEVYNLSDVVIEIEENLGHLKGNSQLLLSSLDRIPPDTDYLIILEAGTWLLDDELIHKYINKMKKYGYCWCSSEWSRRFWSVGIDFAILDYQKLSELLPLIFDFERDPEQYIAYNLIEKKVPFCYIEELMPVHLPKLLNNFFKFKDRRINIFLKAKMISHHYEDLSGKIEEKYSIANSILKKNFFQTEFEKNYLYIFLAYQLIYLLVFFTPKSSWFRKKKFYNGG